MNHALALNIIIVLVVLVALLATGQPLVLLGLLMVKEMPYGLLEKHEEEDEDSGYNGGVAGFAPD